jgi:hypothetical protein
MPSALCTREGSWPQRHEVRRWHATGCIGVSELSATCGDARPGGVLGLLSAQGRHRGASGHRSQAWSAGRTRAGIVSPDKFIPLPRSRVDRGAGGGCKSRLSTNPAMAATRTAADAALSERLRSAAGPGQDPSRRASALEETALPPDHLVLELTEACCSGMWKQYGCLRELKAMGVRLSVGDFARGSSWATSCGSHCTRSR